MRKLIVVLCFASLSVIPVALAQGDKIPLVGNRLEPASPRATSAQLDDFLWQGVRYKNATASLVDANTIRISGGGADVEIPWSKATMALKAKMSLIREAFIARARQAEAQKAGGLENVAGKVIRKTTSGFLIDAGQGAVIHVTGPMSLTDGVSFNGRLRRSGEIPYTPPGGQASSIKNYVPAQ